MATPFATGPAPAADPVPYTGVIATPGEDTVRPLSRPGATAEAPAETVARAGELGRSTVSLGDPTQPGLWLETDLVQVARPGRVTVPSNGRFAMVTLRPGTGGGARASIQTLQLLGLSPTALTEIVIYAQ